MRGMKVIPSDWSTATRAARCVPSPRFAICSVRRRGAASVCGLGWELLFSALRGGSVWLGREGGRRGGSVWLGREGGEEGSVWLRREGG